MPPPDKIRPLREMRCREEGCEFHSTQEWAALRHEQETDHSVDWGGPDLMAALEASLRRSTG